MIIAVDFDGTCVTHDFPRVGANVNSVPVLKRLVESGHKLILFTMRSNVVKPESEDNLIHLESGNYLDDAVNWFNENQIPLYGIQTNPTQKSWTSSPKAYAELYIDDAALGCPLMMNHRISERPFVDWTEVEKMLEARGII